MDDKLEAEANAGRVHFGGCVIDDPNRHCNDCETDFDTKAQKRYGRDSGPEYAPDDT